MSRPQTAARPVEPTSSTGIDKATGLAVDADGAVCIVGYSQGSGTGYDFVTLKYAADGRLNWARRYSGPGNGDDKATAIGVDSSGNIFVTGISQGEGTGRDYATVKYSPSGALLWVRRYSGEGNGYDFPVALVVDGAGDVTVTGYSQGKASGYDYLTVQYAADGRLNWAQRYSGPGTGDDKATAIGVDGHGSIYVTGSAHLSAKSICCLTVKYDRAGRQQWTRIYSDRGKSADSARAMAVGRNGDVYITGSSDGGRSGLDYLTVKYDTDGRQQWTKRYDGGVGEDDVAIGVGLDDRGSVYVTGDSYGGALTGHDYLTVKYDSDGKQLWTQRCNGENSSDDRPTAIAVDGAGSVYVTGDSYGDSTGHDYLTVKYDTDGRQQWTKRYSGEAGDLDHPVGIATDRAGDVYVTGYSWGGHVTRFDYSTVKYSDTGILRWVQRYMGKGDEGTGVSP